VVLYDPEYVAFWPVEALPLRDVLYDPASGRKLWTAELPGPGCLDFAFRELRFLPAGTAGCAP
jgi:hypothetical protein